MIDLHGLTQAEAHRALTAFLHGSRDAGRRAVLVITGKGSGTGGGVLQGAVPQWLNEAAIRPMIRAFAHAPPRRGGEGALTVLLKRRR
ncbi:MAG: Smr/MutS family protein [Rhodospirillales bacterium]